MTDAMAYQVHRITDTEHPGVAGIIEHLRPLIASDSTTVWGLFPGLLGLRSNEAYLVTRDETELQLPAGLHSDCIRMYPTARPRTFQPPEAAGVYVFRWFNVKPGSVDEIVQLSEAAWVSFEEDFDARIQGLFVEDKASPATMLLITWYRDLSVWTASRQPSPDARENFLRRHQLTTGALPVATMLHGHGLSLVSHQ